MAVSWKRSTQERARPLPLDAGLAPFSPAPNDSRRPSIEFLDGRRAANGCLDAPPPKGAARLPAIFIRRPSLEEPPLPVILGRSRTIDESGLMRRPSYEDSGKCGTPSSAHRRAWPPADEATNFGSHEGGVSGAMSKITEARRCAHRHELAEAAKSQLSQVSSQYMVGGDKDQWGDHLQPLPDVATTAFGRRPRVDEPPMLHVGLSLASSAASPRGSQLRARSLAGQQECQRSSTSEGQGQPVMVHRHGLRKKLSSKHSRHSFDVETTTPSSIAGSTSVGGDSPISRGTPPATAASIGSLGWKRGSKLGSGSYGCVYTALSSEGRIFAVKQAIMDDTESDRKLIEKLEVELNICKELRHPNIVSYLGHDYVEHQLLIYLEYVPGGSMASILREFGPLDLKPLRMATRGLLEGLNYLHTQNPPVVHRDIKGANVLVDLQFQVKLADFGCSKRSTETKSLTTVGSVPWMAPEVINQQDGHGRKADLWSLGCTIIEMATAQKPWGDGAFDNVVFALRHIGMSDALPPVPEKLDAGLRNLITLLVQRSAEGRPTAKQALTHEFVAPVAARS